MSRDALDPAGALLHNMSVPPKSVIRYGGLGALAQQIGPGGTGITRLNISGHYRHGQALRVELPPGFSGHTAQDILRSLGLDPEAPGGASAVQRLQQLINQRAEELPLPSGCAVIPDEPAYPQPWKDPLAALAVLTKATDAIWLRAKVPVLGHLAKRRSVSLLVPPTLATPLKESPP